MRRNGVSEAVHTELSIQLGLPCVHFEKLGDPLNRQVSLASRKQRRAGWGAGLQVGFEQPPGVPQDGLLASDPVFDPPDVHLPTLQVHILQRQQGSLRHPQAVLVDHVKEGVYSHKGT